MPTDDHFVTDPELLGQHRFPNGVLPTKLVRTPDGRLRPLLREMLANSGSIEEPMSRAKAEAILAKVPSTSRETRDSIEQCGVEFTDYCEAYALVHGHRAPEACPTCPGHVSGPHKMSCSLTKSRLTVPARLRPDGKIDIP